MKSPKLTPRSVPALPVRRQPRKAFALAAALLCTSALAGGWTTHKSKGAVPSARSAPAVGALGKHVYLFSGVFDSLSAGTDTFYHDLYRFDTKSDRWTRLSPRGPVPPARAYAASASHPDSSRFFVFGGAFYSQPDYSDFTVFDDLWAYSARGNGWTQIHASNAGPGGRSRPAAWMVGNRLYLFGGINAGFATLNDLWVYDLDANTWSELMPDGAAGSPPSRHEAMSGARVQGGKLVIYGGETLGEFGFETLVDTWEYSLADNTWENVTPAAPFNIDPPRNLAGAGTLQGRLYIQGGDMPGGTQCCGSPFPQNVSNDLWKFEHGEWIEVTPVGDAAPYLKRHRGVEVGDELFLFSGYDFTDPVGQVWNQNVYSFRP